MKIYNLNKKLGKRHLECHFYKIVVKIFVEYFFNATVTVLKNR